MSSSLSESQIKSLVVDYLIANKDWFKVQFKNLKTTKDSLINNTDAVFHPDIKNEYLDIVKQEISKDLVKNLNIDQANVFIVLESLELDKIIY